MRIGMLALAVLLLAGWGSCSPRAPVPVAAQCDAMCFRPCVGANDDTGVRVTGDPAAADTWDEIGGDVVRQLTTDLRQCDTRRQACEQCLRRLEKQKVIHL